MTELVVDALLIVAMVIALDWRESRWAPRSLSPVRRRAPAMRRPGPVLSDAASRKTLATMERKAS